MDGEGKTPVTAGEAPPPGLWTRLPASTWAGVAVIGVVLFALGIWLPAWRDVAGGVGINYVAAAAGGALFVFGITFAVRARQDAQPRPVEEIPGVEVFRPSTVGRATPVEPTSDEEPQ